MNATNQIPTNWTTESYLTGTIIKLRLRTGNIERNREMDRNSGRVGRIRRMKYERIPPIWRKM